MNLVRNTWLLSAIMATAMAMSLTACGGGSGSGTSDIPIIAPPPPPPLTISMSGKVIDGYVSGATVWLDINGNSVFDTDIEPSVVSSAAGEYAFEFTLEQAECVAYSTLYVDVPVGAIDEDSGEVAQAYQMALPPSITPLTDDEIRHISPLTSVLWEQISAELNKGIKPNLSCENLKSNTQLRNELKQELTSVMSSLVTHYNLSEAQIYADFIADNNTKAYDTAQSIVKGLKASFAHKSALTKLHPDAEEIRVLIYQDKNIDKQHNFNNAWYRNTSIFTTTDSQFFEDKLTQDLNAVDVELTEYIYQDSAWGDPALAGNLLLRKGAMYYNGTYYCSGTETISFTKDEVTYQLSNTTSDNTAATIAECKTSFDAPYERSHYVSFPDNEKHYFAQFIFREAQPEFKALPDWINIKNAEQLNATEFIEHLSLLPKGWDEAVIIDTELWRKRMNDGPVQIDKDSDGKWTKATRQDDGTTVNECSTDGVTWTSCTP